MHQLDSEADGLNFLKATWRMEESCQERTDEFLASAGEKAPMTLERLGTVAGGVLKAG
jgi:hypothetical protein